MCLLSPFGFLRTICTYVQYTSGRPTTQEFYTQGIPEKLPPYSTYERYGRYSPRETSYTKYGTTYVDHFTFVSLKAHYFGFAKMSTATQ